MGSRAVAVLGLGHGLIDGDVIDDGAHRLERADQFGVRDLRAEQEHLHVLDVLKIFERLGDVVGDVFLRHEVHFEMKFLKFRRRGRADRREPSAAERADVFKALEEVFEELRDAIRAGEDEPLVFAHGGEGFDERLLVVRRGNADGGNLQDFRAAFGELRGELAGLLARARDDDALAEERA